MRNTLECPILICNRGGKFVFVLSPATRAARRKFARGFSFLAASLPLAKHKPLFQTCAELCFSLCYVTRLNLHVSVANMAKRGYAVRYTVAVKLTSLLLL